MVDIDFVDLTPCKTKTFFTLKPLFISFYLSIYFSFLLQFQCEHIANPRDHSLEGSIELVMQHGKQ